MDPSNTSPAGTMFCLKDFTDFPAGTAITVDPKHDFKPGDLSSLLKKMAGSLIAASQLLTPAWTDLQPVRLLHPEHHDDHGHGWHGSER